MLAMTVFEHVLHVNVATRHAALSVQRRIRRMKFFTAITVSVMPVLIAWSILFKKEKLIANYA